MRKFTIKEKQNGELAMYRRKYDKTPSVKASWVYTGTDPLMIAEYKEDDKKLYAMRGCLGDKDGMTFEELQEELEAFADEILIGATYEDPEGEWEIVAVEGNKVTVKCIQEGNPNFGRTDFYVDFDKVVSYL